MKCYSFIIRNLIIFLALILLHCIPWFIRNDAVPKPFLYGLATIQGIFLIWLGGKVAKVWKENKLLALTPLFIWFILLCSTPFLTQTMAVYSNDLFFEIHYPNCEKAAQSFTEVDPLENPRLSFNHQKEHPLYLLISSFIQK